jgi:hypothetical protein
MGFTQTFGIPGVGVGVGDGVGDGDGDGGSAGQFRRGAQRSRQEFFGGSRLNVLWGAYLSVAQ